MSTKVYATFTLKLLVAKVCNTGRVKNCHSSPHEQSQRAFSFPPPRTRIQAEQICGSNGRHLKRDLTHTLRALLVSMAMSIKPKNTGGRPKGAPNKTTADARAAIALFVDGNAHRLTGWLNAVADGDTKNDIRPNPAKAFEMFQSVVEYHIPKLARTELTGKNGGPVVIAASPLDELL